MNESTPFVGYVGFVTRAVALIVDVICIDAAALAVAAGVKLIASLVGASSHVSLGLILAGGFVWAFVWAGGYFAAFWCVTGQTPGARLMGFRVVTADGFDRLGLGRASRRVIGFYLSLLPFGIGFLPVLVDDRRRGWHDRFAGTVVRWSPPVWDRPTSSRRSRRAIAPVALPPASREAGGDAAGVPLGDPEAGR